MLGELPLLFLIFILLFLIIEVSTVMLVITGLDRETARFQAISLITSSGYTTSEAELVVRHPVRRKIAIFLMISGTLALAFIISILVRILGKGLSGPEDVFVLVTFLAAVYLLSRNSRVVNFLDHHLEKRLENQPYLQKRTVEELLRIDEHFSVAEVHLSNPDGPWVDKSLGETKLRDRNVIVLSIRRVDGTMIRAPRGRDFLQYGDILLVYGRARYISELIETVT
ncbi:TrkA C-terminal domain-containing protein [Dethiobacter alkaliphilus]|uniref:TrkA-C domain protein n=1 Tax=Dethiobacter alkaliphilus AHT 1 TaxID=555088 RepID=C0GDX7_DETAL|nr:TrkA C-terminal domain-containing protein [Dethiobacter alkaliphilus]EEG78271.1 TrkA-C domain protein [Dethiobacter alkaliphilus AHT 1]